MRKYLVLGLLSVFTLIGGTAMAAGLLVKASMDFYYTGPADEPDKFFEEEYWEEGVSDLCTGTANVPCHLTETDRPALINRLASYGGNEGLLITAAGKRSY
ncbi:hypothetical protein [Parapedobacter sp. 2B3]|uniref:hypothetical protein n=1 Tax=Parapedobacter sp. 2B3 TaxID=3342381 RepID=UPI0035B5FC24